MTSKLGAALFCLVFAIPFGGVGLGASWVLGRMLYDGHRAEEWVRVKAAVDSFDRGSVSYRYNFRGVEYHGDRMGANPIGGTDDIDSWHDDMGSMIQAAKDGSQPLMVWVNPGNPAESMVDRTIRWKLVAFTVPFAFGFGGVGLGAIWMFFRALKPSDDGEAQPVSVSANAGTGLGALWLFAFFWNVISIPIALLAVPQGVENGEWAVLLVLIFPLIGALLVWGAVAATVKRIREKLSPAPIQPVVASRPVNDGVFARGMIGDAPASGAAADAIDTTDDGLPPALNPAVNEIERLSGRKLDARQREALDKMSPQSRAMVGKVAGWLGKIKQEQD